VKAVLQRVQASQVVVDRSIVGQIGPGVLVLLGVGPSDTPAIAHRMVEKIAKLRIFSDSQGKMNLSLLDTQSEVLVVSQFTLYANCQKGNRPSFTDAAPPELARSLYEEFCRSMERHGLRVAQGVFQADMRVSLVNDGPVTILLDSKELGLDRSTS
jgi:D-tyrosyl-tRNA(Tyr) deacylase